MTAKSRKKGMQAPNAQRNNKLPRLISFDVSGRRAESAAST